MKTMTCRDMGGACDEMISGNTVEEIVANGGKHLMSMNDDAHKPAQAMMQDSQNNPIAMQQWMDDFKKKFDALPMS